jgi:hypothetical protein
LGLNDYKFLFIVADLASFTRLHWCDERQCKNQLDKGAQEGQDACCLGGKWRRNGSTGGVSSTMVGWQRQFKWHSKNDNNNAEMTTTKTASTVVGSVGINAGMDTAAVLFQGSTMQGKHI